MKHIIFLLIAILLLSLSGCEAIGDIFSAGFYTGLFVVIAIAVVIVWLIGRRRG